MRQRFHVLKPPRFPTAFEVLTSVIACQQITLAFGLRLLNRLIESCGAPGPTAHRPLPRPEDLAEVGEEAPRELRLSRQKARAIADATRTAADGSLPLEEMNSLHDASVVSGLAALRGVRPCTAGYVLLRGLGRLHVFSGDDVNARANQQRWLGLEEPLDCDHVHRAVEVRQPYAGLASLHLLL